MFSKLFRKKYLLTENVHNIYMTMFGYDRQITTTTLTANNIRLESHDSVNRDPNSLGYSETIEDNTPYTFPFHLITLFLHMASCPACCRYLNISNHS